MSAEGGWSLRRAVSAVAGWLRGWGSLPVWYLALVLAILVVTGGGASYLLWYGVDGARAHFHGIQGVMIVEDCQWESTRRDGGWACSGRFEADDGTVHIDQAEVVPWLDAWPEEPVAARVSSASARHARAIERPYQWVQQLLAGIFSLAGLCTC